MRGKCPCTSFHFFFNLKFCNGCQLLARWSIASVSPRYCGLLCDSWIISSHRTKFVYVSCPWLWIPELAVGCVRWLWCFEEQSKPYILVITMIVIQLVKKNNEQYGLYSGAFIYMISSIGPLLSTNFEYTSNLILFSRLPFGQFEKWTMEHQTFNQMYIADAL